MQNTDPVSLDSKVLQEFQRSELVPSHRKNSKDLSKEQDVQSRSPAKEEPNSQLDFLIHTDQHLNMPIPNFSLKPSESAFKKQQEPNYDSKFTRRDSAKKGNDDIKSAVNNYSEFRNSNLANRDDLSMISPHEFPTQRSAFWGGPEENAELQMNKGISRMMDLQEPVNDEIAMLMDENQTLKQKLEEAEQKSSDDLTLIIELQKKNKELTEKMESSSMRKELLAAQKALEVKNQECENLRLNLKKTNFEAIKMRQNNSFLKQNSKTSESLIKTLERKVKEAEDQAKAKESELTGKIAEIEQIVYLCIKRLQKNLAEESFTERLISNQNLRYIMIKSEEVVETEVLNRICPVSTPTSPVRITNVIPELRDSVVSFDENYSMPNFDVFKKPATTAPINITFPEIKEESVATQGRPDSGISFTINAININHTNPSNMSSANNLMNSGSRNNILDVTMSDQNESFDTKPISRKFTTNKDEIKDQLNSMIKLRTNFKSDSSRAMLELAKKDTLKSDTAEPPSNTVTVDIKVSNMRLSGLFPEDVQLKVVDLLDEFLSGAKNSTTFRLSDSEKQSLRKKCTESKKNTLRHSFIRMFKTFTKYIHYLESQINKLLNNHSQLEVRYDTIKEDHHRFVKNVIETAKENPEMLKSTLDHFNKLKSSSLRMKNELSRSNLIQPTNNLHRSSMQNSKIYQKEDFTRRLTLPLEQSMDFKKKSGALTPVGSDPIIMSQPLSPVSPNPYIFKRDSENIQFVQETIKNMQVIDPIDSKKESTSNQPQSQPSFDSSPNIKINLRLFQEEGLVKTPSSEVVQHPTTKLRTPSDLIEQEALAWKPVKNEQHFGETLFTGEARVTPKKFNHEPTIVPQGRIQAHHQKITKDEKLGFITHPPQMKFEGKSQTISTAAFNTLNTDSQHKDKRTGDRRFVTRPTDNTKGNSPRRDKSSSSDENIWTKFTKVFKK